MDLNKELNQLKIDFNLTKNKIHKLETSLLKNKIPNQLIQYSHIHLSSLKQLSLILNLRINQISILINSQQSPD